MSTGTWNRSIIAGGVILGAAVFCGCAASSISGRVLPGAAPIVTLVEENDSRLTTQGIEGVEIEVKSIGRSGDSRLVGTATTDKDGEFSVPISDRALIKNNMVLTAKRDGVPAVREPVLLPGEGRRVLVLLPRIAKAKESE